MIVDETVLYGSVIAGTMMTFQKGDIVHWHIHGPSDSHITIVARGKFLMDIEGESSRVIQAGDLVDTPPGVGHQFNALIDDARLFTLLKEHQQLEKAAEVEQLERRKGESDV